MASAATIEALVNLCHAPQTSSDVRMESSWCLCNFIANSKDKMLHDVMNQTKGQIITAVMLTGPDVNEHLHMDQIKSLKRFTEFEDAEMAARAYAYLERFEAIEFVRMIGSDDYQSQQLFKLCADFDDSYANLQENIFGQTELEILPPTDADNARNGFQIWLIWIKRIRVSILE